MTMEVTLDYRKKENRKLGFDKFYQFHCQTNDCSPDIAVEDYLADQNNYDFEKRCVMALFHGATYSGPCEIMFADKFPVFEAKSYTEMVAFFLANKQRLYFSPDCKYRKMVFPQFLQSVCEAVRPYGTLGNYINNECRNVYNKEQNYLNLKERCNLDWFHWGRMGHWSFSEALERFTKIGIKPPTMEFGSTGKSHTAGWAFCIGRDDLTDSENISAKDIDDLEKKAHDYITTMMFRSDSPNYNYFTLETACCNYKRQHKGSRYGGCYIDEQYTDLMLFKKDWPEYNWLWDQYIQARQEVFPHSMLYENHLEEEGNDSKEAYQKSWVNALKLYGRMPRVEAYLNDQPQRWTDLDKMPFVGSNLKSLFT